MDEEGASNMRGRKVNEGNSDGAAKTSDHWGGICGCRSLRYPSAQSPNQQTWGESRNWCCTLAFVELQAKEEN